MLDPLGDHVSQGICHRWPGLSPRRGTVAADRMDHAARGCQDDPQLHRNRTTAALNPTSRRSKGRNGSRLGLTQAKPCPILFPGSLKRGHGGVV